MNEVCVVHLVRKKNGTGPFKRFLDSYRDNAAELSHELLIVFKGFSSENVPESYEVLLAGIRHKRYFVKDVGFDIDPYMEVTSIFQYRYFCFFNSYSQILAKGWLRSMHRWITQPGVGIVGATASYQSVSSDFHEFTLVRKPKTIKDILRIIKHLIVYPIEIRDRFSSFPNCHIRTNAFMASRDTLSLIKKRKIHSKWDAYRFESGKDGLTSQVMRMGLSTLVIDKYGNSFKKEHWFESETFWIKDQKNLLVSDNQTRAFTEGSLELRARLSFFAWRRRPDGLGVKGLQQE